MAESDIMRQYLESTIPPWSPIPPIPLETVPRQAAPAPQATGPAPVQPPPATGPTPASDPAAQMQAQIAGLIDTYIKQAAGVTGLQKTALERKRELIEPAIGAVEKVATAKPLTQPTLAKEPPVPENKPRPFLTAEGATALQTVVAGIGAMVTSLYGLSAPIGAMNALTGAMEGWAEGDAARTAKEWQKYEAEVSKMHRNNETALKEYELARVERADDMGAAKALLEARLSKAQLDDYAVQIAQTGMEQTAQLIGVAQKNLNQYQTFENKYLRDMIAAMRAESTLETGKLTRQLLQEKLDAAKVHLSEDDRNFLAEMLEKGDKEIAAMIGRGIQGPEDVRGLIHTLRTRARDVGKGGGDIAAAAGKFQGYRAEQRSLGTRIATLTVASKVAEKLIPAVEEASNNLPRTDIPIINKALKAMNLGLDPEVNMNAAQVKFAVAVNSLAYTYARALNPTGQARIGDLEHISNLIVDSWGKGAIKAGLEQIKVELDREQEGVKETETELAKRFAETPEKATPVQPSPTTTKPAPTATGPNGQKMIYKDGKWQPLK